MDKPMGCFLLQQAHYTHIIYRLLTAEVVKSKVRYLAYAFIQGNLHRHPAVARNQTWVNCLGGSYAMHCAVKTLEHLGVRTIEGILILIRSSSANLNLNAAESIPIATFSKWSLKHF